MKLVWCSIVFVLTPMLLKMLYDNQQEAQIVATQELGPIEYVSGGSWTTRIQAGGTSLPLVGDITVVKGTAVVLQHRSSGSLYVCDADSRTYCYKVRGASQALGMRLVPQ